MHVGRYKAPSPEMNWGADSSSAIILERRLLGHHPRRLPLFIYTGIFILELDRQPKEIPSRLRSFPRAAGELQLKMGLELKLTFWQRTGEDLRTLGQATDTKATR